MAKEIRLRPGGGHQPVFSEGTLSSGAFADLSEYVHVGLAHPFARPEEPLSGPHALSPMQVGLIVWGAAIVFSLLIGLLFGRGRN